MGLVYLLTEMGEKVAPRNELVFQAACTLAATFGAFVTVYAPGKVAPRHKSSVALVAFGLGAIYLLAITAPMGKFFSTPCIAALVVGYLVYRTFRQADKVDQMKVRHDE